MRKKEREKGKRIIFIFCICDTTNASFFFLLLNSAYNIPNIGLYNLDKFSRQEPCWGKQKKKKDLNLINYMKNGLLRHYLESNILSLTRQYRFYPIKTDRPTDNKPQEYFSLVHTISNHIPNKQLFILCINLNSFLIVSLSLSLSLSLMQ